MRAEILVRLEQKKLKKTEVALLWVKHVQSSNLLVNGLVLCTKATDIVVHPATEGFNASDG